MAEGHACSVVDHDASQVIAVIDQLLFLTDVGLPELWIAKVRLREESLVRSQVEVTVTKICFGRLLFLIIGRRMINLIFFDV